jgi:RNA polymerase sigma factor (TIGR02999 family)
MIDATQILSQIENGNPSEAGRLLPLVYAELRKLAATRLKHESPGQTLQGTALVHEVYLRLVDVQKVQRWNSRGHFFAAAAEAMRRILIDHARTKQSLRRGGGMRRIPLSGIAFPQDHNIVELDAINESLDALEQDFPQIASVVKLKFFCGLTIEEIAEALNISVSTVKRNWTYARARLHAELDTSD